MPPIAEESQSQGQIQADAPLQQQQQVIMNPVVCDGEDNTLSTILQRLDSLSGVAILQVVTHLPSA